MKRNFTILLVAAAMLMFAASPAMAGSFRIPEAGTPAMGQANAFVGQADDPSAVHHNAAGIVNLEGTQIMGGMNLITPRSSSVPVVTISACKLASGERGWLAVSRLGAGLVRNGRILSQGTPLCNRGAVQSHLALRTGWVATMVEPGQKRGDRGPAAAGKMGRSASRASPRIAGMPDCGHELALYRR